MTEVTRILYNHTFDFHNSCPKEISIISDCMEDLGYRASSHDIYLAYVEDICYNQHGWAGLPETKNELVGFVRAFIGKYFTKFRVEDK